MEDILNSILEAIENVYNYLFSPEGVILSFLDFLLDGFIYVFDTILNFISDFIFGTLWDKCQMYGDYILSFFYNKFASSTISFNFLAYFVGFIFLIFVFKRVLSLLR